MELNLCLGCMKKKENSGPCPHCGFDEAAYVPEPHHLPPGTILGGKYLLGRVLGEGGFGITYIGWDLVLDLKVAVKEYYPAGMVVRNAAASPGVSLYTAESNADFFHGRDKFLREAKSLAKFDETPGIVKVKDFFQENDTAYIVMEYVEGITMKQFVEKNGGRLPAARVFELMLPVMEALEEVHGAGIIHRDISPDNIMVKSNNQVKLLDFGAAKDLAANKSRSLIVLLKPGYAPEEQYRVNGELGPWTDIYALCATMYYCMTGKVPPEALERLSGVRMQTPSELGAALSAEQEKILLKGLEIDARDRYGSMKELADRLKAALAAVKDEGLPPRQPRPSRGKRPGFFAGRKERKRGGGRGPGGTASGGVGPGDAGLRDAVSGDASLRNAASGDAGLGNAVSGGAGLRNAASGGASLGNAVSEGAGSGSSASGDIGSEGIGKRNRSAGNRQRSSGPGPRKLLIVAAVLLVLALLFFGQSCRDRHEERVAGPKETVPGAGLEESPSGSMDWKVKLPDSQDTPLDVSEGDAFPDSAPSEFPESGTAALPERGELFGQQGQELPGYSDEALGAAEYGNYPPNIENGGLVNFYEHDGDLYIFLCNRNGTLFELYMNDDSLPVSLAANIGYLNVAGHFLYCINTREERVYRMDLSAGADSRRLEKLSDKPAKSHLNLVNTWLYYLDPKGRPCKMRTDGRDSGYERLSDRKAVEYQVMNGWGYCIDENGRAFRVKNDGTKVEELSKEKVYMLNASEGDIYMVLEHSLIRTAPDGSNPKTVLDKSIYAVNVNRGWIYYSDGEDGKKLYRCDLNGGLIEKVRDEQVAGNINVCGLVYFFTAEPDGSESFAVYWPEDE